MRECFVEMEFGSRVYGTALPTSDRDVKGIFWPTATEILMQEVPRSASEKSNPSDSGKRNGPEDTDFEAFSFQRFCNLLMEGQTVAHDMLFTAPQLLVKCYDSRWWSIKDELKKHALSRKVSAAVGYAKAQAERYSARGDRISILIEVVNRLKWFPARGLLVDHVDALVRDLPQSKYITHYERNGERYMEVCGKASGYQTTVYRAEQLWRKQLNEYGARAQDAAKFSGADWKALYHALRIPLQTKELLLTGHITFPRPEAPLLLEIRQGLRSYDEVSEMIEQAAADLVDAQAKSVLAPEPNRQAVRELIEREHGAIVLGVKL